MPTPSRKSLPIDHWVDSDYWTHDRILKQPEFTLVDFEGCDASETAAVYRALSVQLILSERGSVVLRASGSVVEGHFALRDVLRALMRTHGSAASFRFALCADSTAIRDVFMQVQTQFQSPGFEIRVFEADQGATAWCASWG